MEELKLLKSLWNEKPVCQEKEGKWGVPKSRKSSHKKFIIDFDFDKKNNSVRIPENDWAFELGKHFFDALGLKYTQYQKSKNKIIVEKGFRWEQTPFLNFKEGDTIYNKDKKICLEIDYSQPISWDKEKEKMNLGIVKYRTFTVKNGIYDPVDISSCNQMEFLFLLKKGVKYGEETRVQSSRECQRTLFN